MNFEISVTTNGQAALADFLANGQLFRVHRVTFGSGTLPDGTALADVHQLFQFVADGTIADRRYENNQLSFEIQYSNREHRDVPAFLLTEFMVWCKNPDTNEEFDLLYGYLGDYKQLVPAYSAGLPESVFNYPLTIVVSNELRVSVTAPSGLVRYDELVELLDSGGIGTSQISITIPKNGWTNDTDTGGQYAKKHDINVEDCTESMTPQIVISPGAMADALNAELAPFVQSLDGKIRVYAQRNPTRDIAADLFLTGMTPYIKITEPRVDGVGAGFTLDENGVLRVKLGNGLTLDESGNITVDTGEVVTDADLLDEDATAAELRTILNG